MVIHLVLFRPRADLDAVGETRLIQAIEAAATQVSSVRSFRVGRRMADGPAYLAGTTTAYPFAAVVEFDDRAGLDEYLAHPIHGALGHAFNASLEAALICDYEARDASAPLASFLRGE